MSQIETGQRIRGESCLLWSIALLCFLWQDAIAEVPPSARSITSLATAESDHYEWTCSTADKKNGVPIAGVHISWELRRPHPVAAGEEASLWKGQFVSDQNGKYEVRIPKSVVDAAKNSVGIEYQHPRYLPSRHSSWPLRMPDDPIGKGIDHRHAKLEPGVKVNGRIVQPDGSPARDVPVMFASNRDGFGDSNGGYDHGFWTRTDADGRYLLYTRNTWPQRVHWFPDRYEANSRALTQNFGEQATIRLKSGLALAGKVVDAQGKPLEGIVVQAWTGTRVPYLFAISDTAGVFRFSPLPAGSYRLAPVRSYHDNVTGDSLSAPLPFPIPSIDYVLSDATASTAPKAVIQASPLIKIPVEVVDGEGNPLTNVMLSIGDMGNFENAVLAQPVEGSPGKFEFLFPRDQYIRDLGLRRSMEDAVFYQINRNHPPVAAEAIVLGKAQKDLPTVRVTVRKAVVLTVKARTADGKEPTGQVQVSASYGPETENRIQAAERANLDPQVRFIAPQMFHTYPADQPWNPTFQQLIPGESIVLSVRSDRYTAEPKIVTLQVGEHKTVEVLLKKMEGR